MTSSLIRALHIALGKYHDKESPETIYIALISGSPANQPLYLSARRLAEEIAFEEPHLHSSECLAECEIRPDAFQHIITLDTLMYRGLRQWIPGQFRTPEDLRDGIGRALFDKAEIALEVGLEVGLLARRFMAGVLTKDIAMELLHGIVRPVFDEESVDVEIGYEPAKKVLGKIEGWIAVGGGVDTVIMDWPEWVNKYMESEKKHQTRMSVIQRILDIKWFGHVSEERMRRLERMSKRDAVRCSL